MKFHSSTNLQNLDKETQTIWMNRYHVIEKTVILNGPRGERLHVFEGKKNVISTKHEVPQHNIINIHQLKCDPSVVDKMFLLVEFLILNLENPLHV